MIFFVNFEIFEKMKKFEKIKKILKKKISSEKKNFFWSVQKNFWPKTIPDPRVVHMQNIFEIDSAVQLAIRQRANRQICEFITYIDL